MTHIGDIKRKKQQLLQQTNGMESESQTDGLGMQIVDVDALMEIKRRSIYGSKYVKP